MNVVLQLLGQRRQHVDQLRRQLRRVGRLVEGDGTGFGLARLVLLREAVHHQILARPGERLGQLVPDRGRHLRHEEIALFGVRAQSGFERLGEDVLAGANGRRCAGGRRRFAGHLFGCLRRLLSVRLRLIHIRLQSTAERLERRIGRRRHIRWRNIGAARGGGGQRDRAQQSSRRGRHDDPLRQSSCPNG